MTNASGIIFLAAFADGDGNLDGDTPMGGGDPAEVGGVANGDSPMSGGSPTEQGGVTAGDSPMSGGSPTEQGGVTAGDSPMSGGSPTEQGGVTAGDSPMSGGNTTEALVGNIGGVPADGSERLAQGGLGARINGVAFSERDELDHVSDFPGLELTGQDISAPVSDRRAEVTYRVAGEVEVGRITLNAISPPATQIVFTPSGSQARLIATRIIAVALDVTVVVTQPQIDLRKTVLGDILAQVAIGFTATGQCDEFPCASPRQVVNLAEDLVLGVPVVAAADTYTVQLIVLGRVVPA